MTEEKKNSKLANLIVRSVTGVLFVAIVVAGFLTPIGMEAFFAQPRLGSFQISQYSIFI